MKTDWADSQRLSGVNITYPDAAHLLRRTGFAASKAVITSHLTKTREQLVDHLLDFSPNASIPAFIAPPSGDYGTPYVRYWIERMAKAPAPLQERLTLFWHNHFATSSSKVGGQRMQQQVDLLRAMGDGDFNTLTKAVSLHPSMLYWLDNAFSRKPTPNENFSRELLELFMLGEKQGYTEDDVRALAFAWTGHSTDSDILNYVFKPTWHDTANKTIFGSTANWDGPNVIDQMVVQGGALSVVRSRVAKFVATKLWSWFATPNASPAMQDRLGALLGEDPNMNIRVFLRKMFLLDEFYADDVKQGLVRNPVDWALAMVRPAGFVNWSSLGNHFASAGGYIGSMEMVLLQPPNVAGWENNDHWLSEPAVWQKAQAAEYICGEAVKAAPAGTGFLNGFEALAPDQALQFALDSLGEDRITVGSPTWNALLALINNARNTTTRRNVLRAISLTPEFTLA